ncbi:fibronectin type III domain-containing protein [Planctomycetaceae bacterium SH139]
MLKTRRSLIVASLLSAAFVFAIDASTTSAHEGHTNPVAVKPTEMYAPSPIPDRIVLTWADDPTTTQSVTWRTSSDVQQAYAEIAVATGDPKFDAAAVRVYAATEALETDINTAHFHSVTFRDLQPATRYAYRVGDGNNWSEWLQFSTAATDIKNFSFIYFGDAQNDLRSKWSRVIREAYRDAPKAAFLLHAGDLVNRAESDAEWGAWFDAGNFLNAMIPNVVVPGNHEQARSWLGVPRLSNHWRPQFTLPENGPPGLEETCYTLTYGHLRIIALNSNEDYAVQAEWLRKVLSENTSQWVVCTFHHPVFSTGKNRDNRALRKTWKPVLDAFKVDLVLQGHDHTYGRTGLTTPDDLPITVENVPTGVSKIDESTGTVYVVSVSGPKMYSLDKKPFMVKATSNTQLYQVIKLEGDTLHYEARTAVGELYDKFSLKKQPGEVNELIEYKIANH